MLSINYIPDSLKRCIDFKKLNSSSPKIQCSKNDWQVNEWLTTMSQTLFRARHRMLWSKKYITPNPATEDGSFSEMI